MQLELSQRIRDILTLDPDKGALEFKHTWYTWRQLQHGMESIEQRLHQAGLEDGAAVAIVLRNRPAHVAAILQILASKRCIVPVNPFQSADKIAADLDKLKTAVVLADPEDWQHQAVKDAVSNHGAVAIAIDTTPDNTITAKVANGSGELGKGPFHEALPNTAILMLTSGTTGPAKRISLSHKSFEQSVMSAVQHYAKDGGALKLKSGVSLLSGPLVHIGGLYFVFDSVVSGRSFCLLEKFSVDEWVSAVKKHKIKAASLPPTAIRMIMDAGTPKEDIDSLIALRSGSAPLPLDLQEEFEEKYGIAILDVYGATEFSGAIAGWTLKDHQQYSKTKRGSVGRPQPGVELRVIDADSSEEVDNGVVGLLEVRSKQASNSNWITTTDLAEIDADGFLYIRGRADNAIIRGGFKVLPLEVENIILQHPAVKHAAVLGIPDRRLGAVPVAAVELQTNASVSEEELINFVKHNAVAYKTPTQIKIMDELPRTDSMKVSLHTLKNLFMNASQ